MPGTDKLNFIQNSLKKFWPAILIGSVWLWLFWPMMSGQMVCGFRDSASLYYPLFKWIDLQWASGEIPLWNPYCNYGMPVVGDGSSSVFYPGKLVFFCRFLSYPSRYGIYLAMHIPIAATGTYWLARTFKSNKSGATLAACGYAFGGSVLFQVTNVIFLVSAAWIPFAVCCVWKMGKTNQIKWAIAGAVCCSLMILGGDPQMVYHVGLIALGTILFETVRIRNRRMRTAQKHNKALLFLLSSTARLLLMVGLTTALSAIQLLPTYQWARRSERSNTDHAANIYQILSQENNSTENAIAIFSEPTGTIEHTYQFSKEPWSMLELLWPNFSGKLYPTNQRWANFAASDRIWVPSIYMGIMIAVLGFSSFRMWGRRRKNVWLSWVFLFFCFGSFGWYGGVWLCNEFLAVLGLGPISLTSGNVGPQVGGVYWLMQILLPEYFVFRYPAKLMVVASLALAILGGIGFRNLYRKPFLWLAGIFIGVSLVKYILVCSAVNRLPDHKTSLGFFDRAGSEQAIGLSSVQAPIVLLFSVVLAQLFLARLYRRTKAVHSKPSTRPAYIVIVQIAVVVLSLVDILLANHWLIANVSVDAFKSTTQISQQIKKLKENKTDQSPVQLFRRRDASIGLVNPEHPNERLASIIKQQRESLYPKLHLEHDVMLIGSFSSVWPEYYERMVSLCEVIFAIDETGTGSKVDPNISLPPNFVGVDGLIDDFCSIYKPPAGFANPDSIAPVVWIGSDEWPQAVSIISFSANRVVAKLKSESKGELAFGRIAEPGWYAKIRNISLGTTFETSLEVNKSRETLLLQIDEPGEYEVEFWYMPTEFVIGAWVSGASWLLLFGFLFTFLIVKRR